MARSRAFKVSTGLNVTTVNTALHVVTGDQATNGKILCLDSSGDIIFRTNAQLSTDMNAGDKKFEEKLKIVTLAYTQLKLAYKEKK